MLSVRQGCVCRTLSDLYYQSDKGEAVPTDLARDFPAPWGREDKRGGLESYVSITLRNPCP